MNQNISPCSRMIFDKNINVVCLCWLMLNKTNNYELKLSSLFQTMKSAFRYSELWRPRDNRKYKGWKDFKEKKRRELEQFLRHESLWEKIVRIITGNSPLRSRLDESSSVQTKY